MPKLGMQSIRRRQLIDATLEAINEVGMHDATIAQIARRAGFDWFLTQKISWNDTTKFPHHSFMWEGIDGTRILTHFPPSDTYCSSMSMRELMY